MRALVGKRKSARLQHVAGQKIASQRKSVANVAAGGYGFLLAQKGRQAHHLVGPWLAGLARYRASRFRRDVNEIDAATGRCTLREIEAEAEFRQKLQLETHHHRGGDARVIEPVENIGKRLMEG